MNIEACANCLVHGWKQLEDEAALLQCSNCKLILYCSKECQVEHWNKVHRHHCEYFAESGMTEFAQHKEPECVICQQAAEVGESSLRQAENPNYECIHTSFQDLPQDRYHPHPFPVAGDPEDIREKAVIVLWQLARKFKLIHPNVARICEDDFLKVENELVNERLHIWFNRKIYPKPQAEVKNMFVGKLISGIEVKMETIDMDDPYELWKIIKLVVQIEREVDLTNMSQFLKDPLTNLPDDIQEIVSDGMNNTDKFLTVANDVLEALAVKITPYKEVLRIICGGSLEQKCSFCSKEVLASIEYFSNGRSYSSNIFFSRLLLGKYSCGGEDCTDQSIRMLIGFTDVLLTMRLERYANMCDFCFRRTPVKQEGSAMRDIHRCRYCPKTMYCGMDCLQKDWKVHLQVCHKDKDGRKKKIGGSARRAVAREEREEMEKEAENV